VSGDISFGKHEQDDGAFDDTKTIASLNVHRNTTGRFYNYYYGLGASFGTYHFKEAYNDLVARNEKKNFYNINLKTGINYALTTRKIDFRFIGFELAYANEFGPYQDKLSELSKMIDDNLIIVDKKSLFTINFTRNMSLSSQIKTLLLWGSILADYLILQNQRCIAEVPVLMVIPLV
jgi:hypothetical protein